MKSSFPVYVILASLILLCGCGESSTAPFSQDMPDQSDGNDKAAIADSAGNKERVPVFPRSPAPSHLHVFNCYSTPYEEKILLVSLQGVLAKTNPRLYLIYQNEVDTFWLNEMADDYGVTYETAFGTWELMDEFASEAQGLIVYDPAFPSTVNLAATLAGLNNALVVSPTLLAQVQNDYGLPVTHDLRGQFADRVTMYQWAMDNIWPLANQTIMAFSDPQLFTLRDYLIAHNIMCIMLDPHIPDERALLEEILAETPPHIPLLGWAIDELLGVIVFSEGNKFHVASDWARNMSVTSGLPAPTLSQSHAAPYTEEIEPKTYIAFAYTDGDNVAYTLDAMYHKWQDPARGDIPLGWEISFNVIDLAPQSIRYFYETATPNDMFIGPACGIGYIYPRKYKDLDTFVEITRPYMEAADMDTIWLINDDLTLADDLALAYTSGLDLSGIFIDYWPNLDKGFYYASDGTPVLRSQYVYLVGPEQIPEIIEGKKIEKDYLYPDSPFFLFIGVNGWITEVSYLKSIVEDLDTEHYVVLRPDEMFMAMRRAYDEGWEF